MDLDASGGQNYPKRCFSSLDVIIDSLQDMLLAWIVFIFVAGCAFYDFKKTVIVWMACRLLFNPQVALRYASPAMSLDFGVAILLIALFFIKGKRKSLTKEKFYLEPILIATLASYLLSTLFSISLVGEGFRVLVKLVIMNFAILYVFQRVLRNSDDIRLFVKAMIIVTVIISALGIFESIFHDNPYLDYIFFNSPQEGTEGRMYYIPPRIAGSLQMRYGLVRAYSTFGIHISFGSACVFLLGFLLVIRKMRWLEINRWMMITAIALAITGCITSNSKTAYLGMFVMLLLLVKPSQWLSYKTVLVIITAILVVVVAYQYVPGYFDNIGSLFDKDLAEEGGGSTVIARQRQLAVALEMFQQNPLLGNGPGSLTILRRIGHGSDILGAEGAHLSILPERGLIGYVVYLATFIYLFVTMRKIMPTFKIFIFLFALFAMEIASGLRDMTLYWSLIIAIRKVYILDREKSPLKYVTNKSINKRFIHF